MEKAKKLFLFIAGCLLIFFAVTYCGNVVQLGEKLNGILSAVFPVWLGNTAEFLFDFLLILGAPLFAFCILWQKGRKYRIAEIASLHLQDNHDDDPDIKAKREDFARYLVSCQEERTPDSLFLDLKNTKGYHNRYTLLEDLEREIGLREVLTRYLEACREKAAKKSRKTALIAAASVGLNPSSAGDTLIMMFWNIRVVTDIINIYGMRPKGFQIVKLYFYILFGSFLSGSIDELFDHLESVPVIGKIPLLGNAVEGVFAYYRIIRTRELTVAYLEHGVSEKSRKEYSKEASNKAFKEAFNAVPELVKDNEAKEKLKEIKEKFTQAVFPSKKQEA